MPDNIVSITKDRIITLAESHHHNEELGITYEAKFRLVKSDPGFDANGDFVGGRIDIIQEISSIKEKGCYSYMSIPSLNQVEATFATTAQETSDKLRGLRLPCFKVVGEL